MMLDWHKNFQSVRRLKIRQMRAYVESIDIHAHSPVRIYTHKHKTHFMLFCCRSCIIIILQQQLLHYKVPPFSVFIIIHAVIRILFLL